MITGQEGTGPAHLEARKELKEVDELKRGNRMQNQETNNESQYITIFSVSCPHNCNPHNRSQVTQTSGSAVPKVESVLFFGVESGSSGLMAPCLSSLAFLL